MEHGIVLTSYRLLRTPQRNWLRCKILIGETQRAISDPLGPRENILRRFPMKPFEILRLPILLGGLAVGLLLSPACKAQEVVPEQFADNNTESWEKPSRPAPQADKAKSKPVAAPARATKPTASQETVRLASARKSAGSDAVADKRKTPTRKPKK